MGRIDLHIANASNYFTDRDVAAIKDGVQDVEDFISENFDFNYEVDLIVTAPSFMLLTIAEDGIGARTYSSRLMAIVLDKKQAPIRKDTVFETVSHEMSHSLRWEKNPNDYTKTLFDEAILEGLAVVLEEKALKDTGRKYRQFFLREMQSTDQDTIRGILAELGDKLHDADYSYWPEAYNTLFYGGSDKLPRWAGYRLGYYLIKKYLSEADITINEATTASYNSFKVS